MKLETGLRKMALGVCAASLVAGLSAQTTSAASSGATGPVAPANGSGITFDTRYTSTDGRLVVFDDGKQTFLALPTSKDLPQPVVMAIGPAGQELLQPVQLAPYVQLPGLYNRIRLVWGNGRDVQIAYNGPSTLARSGPPAAYGAAAPVALHGALSKPVNATPNQGAATGMSGQPAQTPTTQSQVATAATTVAAVATVPAEKIIVEQVWEIKATDANLASAFERWSAAAGMRLLWDAQQHVTLSTSDQFTGTFDEAITRVLSSPAIAKSKYPLEACIYANSPPVLRITKLGEQECAK